MKTMKITPWIAAIALTVAVTPALRAQYGQPGYDQQGQRDGYSQGWRYGNPSQSWRGDRVATLAHEIDETAAYIHEQAERNNRRPNRSEEEALAELHQLNDAAAHFHDQVEENSEDYNHTRDDFAELIDAYNQTVEALRYIQPRSYINRGMNRVATDMVAISRYYGNSYGRIFSTDRWSSRSGRNNHDGYGHRDRNDGYNDDGYRPPVR